MGYKISCIECGDSTWPANIVDLIEKYSDAVTGEIRCKNGHDGYIYKENRTQDEDNWQRYIKGVIRIPTGHPTYSPFVFLVSDRRQDTPNSVHFGYYRETGGEGGRKLKHGAGPGGAPVLSKDLLLDLVRRLRAVGFLSRADIENLLAV